MATITPEEALSVGKIEVMLDDLYQDSIDACDTSSALDRTKLVKALDRPTKATISTCFNACMSTANASETERNKCLDGKSKDLKKMRTCLTKQLDALDALEELNGRLQVLEDKAIEVKLAAFLALVVLARGSNGKLILLQKRLEALRTKLDKAIKACRDAKIKGILGAGFAAIGLCLVPFGAGVAVVGGITLVGIEVALGQALKGNQETILKKSWSAASGAGAVADGLGKMPKTFAPVMIILTIAVDAGEAFVNERERKVVMDEIKKLSADFKSILPACATEFTKLDKATKDASKAMTAALASVKSFKPTTGKVHQLPKLI